MSSGDRYYITTAIDYSNGPPHMGHAFEKIGADAMARYHRLKGERVRFLAGLDEHGLKVMQTAASRGITPQTWVDDIAAAFTSTWQRLLISNDDFIRTTDARHRHGVVELIRRIQTAGDLYLATYAGHYCVGCEAFKKKEELEEIDGALRCPLHPSRDITWSEEENWFFRLSRYQDRLLKLLDERPEFVQPEIRRNEIRRAIERGLEDISVSRTRLPWGIAWPGDEAHTVYVWLDALTNYLSATGFPENGYEEIWPADVHVIGKDITRFHCIYWPAFLMSAGVELPRSVWGHGFINFGGAKLSKSAGVTVELEAAITRHGPEALRYYLLADVPWNSDGDFSVERFDDRYTADLANNVGNLVNRTLSMIERYRGGVVPQSRPTRLDSTMAAALLKYRAAMDDNLLHHGAAAAIELASASNVFIEEQAPWSLAKDPGRASDLDDTLGALARALAGVSSLLEPFVPERMAGIAQRLGLPGVPRLDQVISTDLTGQRVSRGEVLFPKPRE
ncbi:MAG TPA: methionine--tRNA ligase [Longimicrobiales bacterium]|nr:methionine--tRNA ligase [Longimicrobiales bacterium]